MKKNNKGFTLLETLIASTFVLSTLIFLYIQFSAVKRSYESSFKYNTISGLYSARILADYIKKDDYSDVISALNSSEYGYVDISNSNNYSFNLFYDTVKEAIDAKQVIITHNDISILQNKLATSKELDSKFSSSFKKFIMTIDSKTTNGKDRLIIKFIDNNKNETFADVTIGDNIEYPLYNNGDVVYYNPASGEKCNSSEAVSTTGTKTGCMKWYAFNDTKYSSTVNLLLDHNTTTTVKWNDENSNVAYESSNLKPVVDDLVTTNGWKVTPRLITANEVAKITNHSTFDASKTGQDWYCLDSNVSDSTNYCAKAQGTSNYKWLFNYTNGCTSYGCDMADSNTYGYWTSTPYTDSSNNVWIVYRAGDLNNDSANDTRIGVRPVITVSKNTLQ